MQKTTLVTKEGAERNWVLVDLKDKALGRAATCIANILRGKNKVRFTPHIDTGDFVVAINAGQVKLTGKKPTDKIYYRHTGFPGGIKEVSAGRLRETNPPRLIERAVHGMLPKNRMNKHLLRKLHVYAGSEHPHAAQKPRQVQI